MTPEEQKKRNREKSAAYYLKNSDIINAKRRVKFKNSYEPTPRQRTYKSKPRNPIELQDSQPADSNEAISLIERFHKFRKLSRK